MNFSSGYRPMASFNHVWDFSHLGLRLIYWETANEPLQCTGAAINFQAIAGATVDPSAPSADYSYSGLLRVHGSGVY